MGLRFGVFGLSGLGVQVREIAAPYEAQDLQLVVLIADSIRALKGIYRGSI